MPSPTFLLFLLTGGIAAAVDWSSRIAYNLWAPYSYAIVAAYLTGMITAFVLAKIFVFTASTQSTGRSALIFTLVNIAAVIQTWAVSIFLAHYMLPSLGMTWHVRQVAHSFGVIIPVSRVISGTENSLSASCCKGRISYRLRYILHFSDELTRITVETTKTIAAKTIALLSNKRTVNAASPLYITYAIIAAFTAAAICMALTHGLCCADDASFAIVSKNLSRGLGYVLSINYDNQLFVEEPFPPRLGMGPTSIFFVAAAMKVFGYALWVPAVASVVLNALLLCIIAAGLRSIVGAPRLPWVILLFLICSVSINSLNAEFWYTQFGEVPAILASLAGYIFWCRSDRRTAHTVTAGVLLALGFLTKELNAIYLVPAVVVAFADATKHRSFRDLALLCIGMAVPVLCFEAYRLVSLGSLSAYASNWKAHIQFVVDQGSSGAHLPALKMLQERAAIFEEHFRVPIWLPILCAIAGIGLARESDSLRTLYFLLLSGATMHLAYWIFKSNGWPRYAYEALVCVSLLTAISILSAHEKIWRIALIATCIFIVIRAGDGYQFQRDMMKPNDDAKWLAPTGEADKRTLAYLSMKADGHRIYTQWWAQIANLEYASPKPVMFQHWYFAPPKGKSFTMVTNQRLIYRGDPKFFEFMERCGEPVFVDLPYKVYTCY